MNYFSNIHQRFGWFYKISILNYKDNNSGEDFRAKKITFVNKNKYLQFREYIFD